jgi:hypothetical protein
MIAEVVCQKSLAHCVTCVDVDGGHSTMLQELFVDSLATALLPYLQPKAELIQQRPRESAVA